MTTNTVVRYTLRGDTALMSQTSEALSNLTVTVAAASMTIPIVQKTLTSMSRLH